jgi:hypothetical protein
MLVSQKKTKIFPLLMLRCSPTGTQKPINVRLRHLAKYRQQFGCAGRDRAGIITINMSTYTIALNYLNVYKQIATDYLIFLRIP